jgi:hypothetical protein
LGWFSFSAFFNARFSRRFLSFAALDALLGFSDTDLGPEMFFLGPGGVGFAAGGFD